MEMETEPQPKVFDHITFCKGAPFPRLKKCITCCLPGYYHCPFCPPEIFKPSKKFKLKLHLDNHLRSACQIEGYRVHRCGLNCRRKPHYHCLYCTATLIRKRDYVNHVPICLETQKCKMTRRPNYMDSEDSDAPGYFDYCVESGDEEGSKPLQTTPAAKLEQMKPIPVPVAIRPIQTMCDQMVQTHIEKPQDCDEFYFMNLVKLFKKLTPQKKSDVRLKIERILFEAEFQ